MIKRNMLKKNFILILFLMIFVAGVVSSNTISNYDYSSGSVFDSSYYSTGLDYGDCSAGTDFLVQIEPFSCEPKPVTSDLLEEEPVTVFCKLVATQVNPFIDVDSISNLRISGEYSSAIQSVGYFPSESALSYWTDGSLDNLALNDLGYVAITLRQNGNESSMPEFVDGTLTARLTYDVENSFGVGNAQFYLPVLNDADFEKSLAKYSFWDGRGYLRATSVDDESANIVLYGPSLQRTGGVQLERGELSNEMYIQGMNPCLATMKIRLNGVGDPDTRVKLKVNSDYIEVAEGESFLDGLCRIKSVKKDGLNQKVSIYCKSDEKSETFELRLSPKVNLEVNGETKEYSLGDYLYTDSNEKSVYLGYVGSKGDSTNKDDLFAVLIAKPSLSQSALSNSELSSISSQMNLLFADIDGNANVFNFAEKYGSKLLGAVFSGGKWVVGGQEMAVLDSSSKINFRDGSVSVKGFSGAEDSVLVSVDEKVYSVYGDAVKDDSGSEVGLSLDYSSSGTPKISLKNSNGDVVANFYGDDCDSHDSCQNYLLSSSGLKFEKGDYDSFFDEVVYGEFNSKTEEFIMKVLVSDGLGSVSSGYYSSAMEDFQTLINGYSSQTTDKNSETYGERGLYEAIHLAYSLNQMKTVLELCNEFESNYPDSNKLENIKTLCEDEYKLANSETSVYDVQIKGKVKSISFEGIYEPRYEDYGAEVVVRASNGKTQSYELRKGKKVYLYGLQDSEPSVGETNSNGIDVKSGEVSEFRFNSFLNEKYNFAYNGNSYSVDVLSFDSDLLGVKISLNSEEKSMRVGDVGKFDLTGDGTVDFELILENVENGKAFFYGKLYLLKTSESVSSDTTNEYIELVSVDEDSARIKVNAQRQSISGSLFELNTKSLNIDESDNFGSNYVFTLIDTNIQKNAKVTIIPSFNYRDSESKFNFSIGIEKRTILLLDDVIDERIKALNNSMKNLNKIVSGLDSFNRALGGVCLATGGYLTLKNLIKNADGSAIARNEIMGGDGGWTERCSVMKEEGKYSSLENCFYDNADKIDNDVAKMQDVIASQNNQIKTLQEQSLNDGVIDKVAFTEKYSDKVSDSLNKVGSSVANSDGKGDAIDITDVRNLLGSPEALSQGIFDSQDLKEIQLYSELYSGAVSNSEEKIFYQNKLYSSLSDLVKNAESFNEAQNLKAESGLENSYAIVNLDKTSKTTEIALDKFETLSSSKYRSFTSSDSDYKINLEDYVYAVKDSSTAKTYLVAYGADGVVIRTYLINGNTLVPYGDKDILTGEIKVNPFNFYFKKYDVSDFENKYLSPELQYYESGSYEGYPSVVPLDVEEGWYVGVKDSDSGVGAYDVSGKVRIVWLCNVGKNSIEEFSVYSNDYGDDVCQQYDLTHDVNTFSGLSLSKTTSLLTKAQRSIGDARDAHKSGVSRVVVDGIRYNVGKPASSSSEIQCENYMSPKDCKLLFNVCDPVVCPSSRCDFGGNYPVADVVQTGVVGSVLLCAPNYKEGIYLPVCTTGVQAGLDSWINIEESYRDCLQEYSDSGEISGVCDKIHSIYACEFFWKQAIPLAKIGVSKASSAISGEGVKGGSEYLRFSSALENAKESVDYFTQFYAAESYNAFKIRSAEEAGSAICKASASIVYTSGADLLDSLVTPRSPAQYTGSFEETTLTTVTNPPTSHYKVYYYIYAGEDTGATFQVYLKGSSSSYYQDASSTYVVDSGYISSGDYGTDTVDFTAPSGYNQLCISVNGAVECGFGKVSTSFADNYLNDLYLKEQSSSTVTTEKECTSGTASLYSLINPNLQGIVENLADSDLYSSGITRTCATENPGKTTDVNYNNKDARWRDVGYCGDKNLRCWIDTDTVKNAIKSLDVEKAVLEDTADNYLQRLTDSGVYISTQNYSRKVAEIKFEGNFDKKISLIDSIIDRVFYSDQKAELFLLRGQAYKVLALRNLISEKDLVLSGEVDDAFVSGVTDNNPLAEIISNCGEVVVGNAKKYADLNYDHTRSDGETDNPCASFVSKILSESGVDEPNLAPSDFYCQLIDSLIANSLKNKGYFDEGYTYEDYLAGKNLPTMKEGDVVIFGNKKLDDNTQHATIFSHYSDDGKSAYVYSDPGQSSPVVLKAYSIADKDGWHISYVYRVTNCGLFTIGKLPQSYVEAYALLENSFKKYSQQNLPNGFDELEFRALLVGISQMETGVGTAKAGPKGSDPGTDWLMGYTVGGQFPEKYRGVSAQLDSSSGLLKKHIDNPSGSYSSCDGLKNDDLLKCILAIYNGGASKPNEAYAQSVLTFRGQWMSYFSAGGDVGSASGSVDANIDLNEQQKFVYDIASTCDSCVSTDVEGNSLCDKNLCSAIGEKLKISCVQDAGQDGTCVLNKDSYLSWQSVDDVKANINMFSENEIDVIAIAQTCQDCGGSLADTNVCDKRECKAISLVTGINCEYKFFGCSGGSLSSQKNDYLDYSSDHVYQKINSPYSSFEDVILDEFSKDEQDLFSVAEYCSDCGGAFSYALANKCDIEECKAIALKTGKDCVYSRDNVLGTWDCRWSGGNEEKSDFSFVERKVIANADSCNDCGNEASGWGLGFQNSCDAQECEAIGNKLGKDCSYIRLDVSNVWRCREVYGQSDFLENLNLCGANIIKSDYDSLNVFLEANTLTISDLNCDDLEVENNRLTKLGVINKKIISFNGLSDLTKLDYLELSNANIVDASGLSDLSSLIVLDLNHNEIEDVSFLEGLGNLKTLNLWYNNLNDLSLPQHLNRQGVINYPITLTYLSVADNCIPASSDFMFLENYAKSGDYTGNPRDDC